MSACAEKIFYANVVHLDTGDDDDDVTLQGQFCKIMTALCGQPVKDVIGRVYSIVVPTYR
jgi:hypothetical protein